MPKRGKKEYQCFEAACDNPAFSRRYELERHKKSRHHLQPSVGDKHFYICAEAECKSCKIWPRADNFSLHVKRVHPGADVEETLRLSKLSVADLPDDQSRTTASTVRRASILQHGSVLATDPADHFDHFETDRPQLCDRQDLNDSAVSLPGVLPKPMLEHSSAVSLQASGTMYSHDAAWPEDQSRPNDLAKARSLPVAIAHPNPVRPSGANVSDWQRELESSMKDCGVGSPSGLSLYKVKAKKAAKELSKTTENSKSEVRLHTGLDRDGGGQAHNSLSNNPGLPHQTTIQGFGSQGRKLFHNSAGSQGPELAGGSPGKQSPATDHDYGFPCVYHKSNGQVDPTVHCRKRRKCISKLDKHHAAQAHPHGPFLYCTRCFKHDFETELEVKNHKRENRCKFLCVTPDCRNYNQEPTEETPCDSHGSYLNSQRYLWEKLYRIANRLGPYDPIPDVFARPTISDTVQALGPIFSVHTPTPPQVGTGIPSTPTPSTNRSTSVISGSSTLATPQHQSFAYLSARGLTPISSPTYSALDNFDPQANAMNLERSLEDLARTMWGQVNHALPAWSELSSGWYQSLSHGLTGPHLSIRTSLLQTLVKAYQARIDDPNRRTQQDWLEVRNLTRSVLQIENIPECCPWAQSLLTGGTQPPLLSMPHAGPSSLGSAILQLPLSDQSRSSQHTLVMASGSRLASPFLSPDTNFSNVHADVMSQTGGSTSTPYERLHAPSRNSYHAQGFSYPNSFCSGPSDPAYVSGSASAGNSQDKGKGRSDFGANQSNCSF